MTTRARRLAHAHAVSVLRSLGRELVAGNWSRGAVPMTEAQAVVVIARAMATVVEVGIHTVVAAFDDRLAELLGG